MTPLEAVLGGAVLIVLVVITVTGWRLAKLLARAGAKLDRLSDDAALTRAGLAAMAKAHQASADDVRRLARTAERSTAAALAARIDSGSLITPVDPFVVSAVLVLAPTGHVVLAGDADWATDLAATLALLGVMATVERLDPEHAAATLARRADRDPVPPVFVAENAATLRELTTGEHGRLMARFYRGAPYLVIAPAPLHYAAKARDGESPVAITRIGGAALLVSPQNPHRDPAARRHDGLR